MIPRNLTMIPVRENSEVVIIYQDEYHEGSSMKIQNYQLILTYIDVNSPKQQPVDFNKKTRQLNDHQLLDESSGCRLLSTVRCCFKANSFTTEPKALQQVMARTNSGAKDQVALAEMEKMG